jgi:uncharacterized membrane protein
MRKPLEVVGLGALTVLLWITWSALYGPEPLPQRIPTHFAANGRANAWGPPSSLWLLPLVGVVVYLFISVVALFPATFNFPVRATALNRPRLEALTLQMIAWIKTELACLFLYIQWSIIRSVRSGTAALSPVIVPFFLVAVFATVGLHAVAVFRAARAGSTSQASRQSD